MPLFYTTTASTMIIYSFLYMVYVWLLYFFTFEDFLDKFGVVIVMVSLGFLNYFLFVRPKKFLEMGFEKKIKGGIFIVSLLVILAVTLVLSMKYYKDKMFGY